MTSTSVRLPRARWPLCAALSVPLLAGCISTTPVWDGRFGHALAAVTRAQVIHPDAPAGLPSLTGVDGKAAVAAMNSYDRSLVRVAPAAAGAGLGQYGGVGMTGATTGR